ncbi:MAG: hypothetical protein V7785_20940 [Bermanella sp.]
MKSLLAASLAVGVTLFSMSSLAATINYELENISSGSQSYYPNLNLSDVKNVNITANVNESAPLDHPEITSIELVFPYANSVSVTDLKFNGTEYIGRIEDAWIYKSLLVRFSTPSMLREGEMVDIAFYIEEETNNLNNSSVPYSFTPALVDASGVLKDVSLRNLSDTETIHYQGKDLIANLYQDLKIQQQNPGFDLNLNWLGHGTANVFIPAPFPIDSMYQNTVKSVAFSDEQTESPILHVIFSNSAGGTDEIQYDLNNLLMEGGLQ